jgi:adenylate cyclase
MEARPEELHGLREQIAENQRIIDGLNRHLARKTDEVRIIQQISFQISTSLDLQEILASILKALDTVLGFQHSMILLLDPDGGALKVAKSRGYEKDGVGAEVPVGTGVIGVVAKKKRMMRIGNLAMGGAYVGVARQNMEAAGMGGDLKPKAELPGLKGAQSQIAFPLLVAERLIGVFAVESLAPAAFDELDEVLLSILSHQAASAIENARLYQDEERRVNELNDARAELEGLNQSLEDKIRERTASLEQAHGEAQTALRTAEQERERSKELLGRMAPPELVPLMLEDKLQARKLQASILFTDLEGFTQYSSDVEPDELFAKLNDFFSRGGEEIRKYRGYVNKTNGDSIMALFGVPYENATHALDAVLAGLDMQKALKSHFGLRMRIGINSGPITAGILGPKDKSLYDVLGDAVNVASRMEKVCPAGSVTVSEQTHALVETHFKIQPLGKQKVKGKGQLPCFEVLGLKTLLDDSRRLDPSSRFAQAYGGVLAEVEDFKVRRLSRVDFPSLQARDGALSHNESVAACTLALKRELKDGSLPEEDVLALALLHDLGKHAATSAQLNDPDLGLPALEALRETLRRETVQGLELLGFGHLTGDLQELYRIERGRGPGAGTATLPHLVAAADIYDALVAPKLYKGKGWSITGSLEELLRLKLPPQAKPIYRAFVALMKPAAAQIHDPEASGVLFK